MSDFGEQYEGGFAGIVGEEAPDVGHDHNVKMEVVDLPSGDEDSAGVDPGSRDEVVIVRSFRNRNYKVGWEADEEDEGSESEEDLPFPDVYTIPPWIQPRDFLEDAGMADGQQLGDVVKLEGDEEGQGGNTPQQGGSQAFATVGESIVEEASNPRNPDPNNVQEVEQEDPSNSADAEGDESRIEKKLSRFRKLIAQKSEGPILGQGSIPPPLLMEPSTPPASDDQTGENKNESVEVVQKQDVPRGDQVTKVKVAGLEEGVRQAEPQVNNAEPQVNNVEVERMDTETETDDGSATPPLPSAALAAPTPDLFPPENSYSSGLVHSAPDAFRMRTRSSAKITSGYVQGGQVGVVSVQKEQSSSASGSVGATPEQSKLDNQIIRGFVKTRARALPIQKSGTSFSQMLLRSAKRQGQDRVSIKTPAKKHSKRKGTVGRTSAVLPQKRNMLRKTQSPLVKKRTAGKPNKPSSRPLEPQRVLHGPGEVVFDKDGNPIPFHCKCGLNFVQERSFKRHVTSSTAPIFKCSHCTSVFPSRESLSDHTAVHSGVGFQCPICNKMISRKGNLKTHKLIHSGAKPFTCSRCKKQFRQVTHLWKHQLNVHRLKVPILKN